MKTLHLWLYKVLVMVNGQVCECGDTAVDSIEDSNIRLS